VPTPTPVRFPADYGITAVPGEKLPWETVERWLVRSRNYWICTTRPDGRPHAKPVWGVWLDGAVLWSTDDNSVTGRNLAANTAVSIHLESGDEAAILDGESTFEAALTCSRASSKPMTASTPTGPSSSAPTRCAPAPA
jgi:hypothetical protein